MNIMIFPVDSVMESFCCELCADAFDFGESIIMCNLSDEVLEPAPPFGVITGRTFGKSISPSSSLTGLAAFWEDNRGLVTYYHDRCVFELADLVFELTEDPEDTQRRFDEYRSGLLERLGLS